MASLGSFNVPVLHLLHRLLPLQPVRGMEKTQTVIDQQHEGARNDVITTSSWWEERHDQSSQQESKTTGTHTHTEDNTTSNNKTATTPAMDTVMSLDTVIRTEWSVGNTRRGWKITTCITSWQVEFVNMRDLINKRYHIIWCHIWRLIICIVESWYMDVYGIVVDPY